MYETMWLDLKEMLIKKKAFHQTGEMQSISEAVQGVFVCDEILSYMTSLEKECLGRPIVWEKE